MNTRNNDTNPVQTPFRIDWADIKFTLLLGVIMTGVKVLELYVPILRVSGETTGSVASILILGYVIFRAEHEPEKLKAWGLTVPLTGSALLTGLVMLFVSVGVLALGGIATAGRLAFEPAYVTQMVNYIPGAFPQQFAMCSVGLATLAALPLFRGLWRLPLAVGLIFSLLHFWTPARIPGTIIPLQMVLTFPAGFFVTLYFLKFRSILPLIAIHAIVYPLLHNWIERQL